MGLLPNSLEKLIDALGQLPSVGPRSAERYAYFLLKRDKHVASSIADSLLHLHSGVKVCPVTHEFIDAKEDVSPRYADPMRDKHIIAVVADPFDVIAIEKTGLFKGTYHVLGGLISPIDGVTIDDLHIQSLQKRIEDDAVTELIIATNASVEGETTALYLQQLFEGSAVSLTRLARGLSVGVDLEYADHISLGRALEGRQKL
jgi:recombination protein RecR